MTINRLGCTLYKDPGTSTEPWTQGCGAEAPLVPGTDGPEAHLKNFLDSIKTRSTPICPPELAANAVAGPHMANLALKQDKKIHRDASGNLS